MFRIASLLLTSAAAADVLEKENVKYITITDEDDEKIKSRAAPAQHFVGTCDDLCAKDCTGAFTAQGCICTPKPDATPGKIEPPETGTKILGSCDRYCAEGVNGVLESQGLCICSRHKPVESDWLLEKVKVLQQYADLKQINAQLMQENEELKENISTSKPAVEDMGITEEPFLANRPEDDVLSRFDAMGTGLCTNADGQTIRTSSPAILATYDPETHNSRLCAASCNAEDQCVGYNVEQTKCTMILVSDEYYNGGIFGADNNLQYSCYKKKGIPIIPEHTSAWETYGKIAASLLAVALALVSAYFIMQFIMMVMYPTGNIPVA